jgi:hypothetical protein
MEIGTHVRSLLKKSWIVVLIAVLAGGATYLVVRGTKDTHQGTVNVTVPVAQSATAGANGQYVANFTVALTTASVLAQVSEQTGESKSALSSGLGANQLGNSSFIQVTYTASHSAKAEQVVLSAAEATANLLAQPAVDAATTTLNASKNALAVATAQEQAAEAAMAAYSAKHGLIDPNVLYQAAQSSITQLNVSKQQAIAQARPTANFDAAIAVAQARLNVLAPQVVAFNALSRSLNQAQLATATAQARVVSASGAVSDANSPPLIGTPDTTLVSGRSTIVQAVAVATGLGFVLGLALLLLIEFLSATRRRPQAQD